MKQDFRSATSCHLFFLLFFFLPSSNFLESAGDDEISVIHGKKISSELTWEMILVIKFLPIEVRVWILGFLQSMSNSTLCSPKFLSQQGGSKVSLTVVSNDQVWFSFQFFDKFFCNILIINLKCILVRKHFLILNALLTNEKCQIEFVCFILNLSESFHVWPDFESWDPFAQQSLLSSEWNTNYVRMFCPIYFLHALTASGTYCIRQQPGYLDKTTTTTQQKINSRKQETWTNNFILRQIKQGYLQQGCEGWSHQVLEASNGDESHSPLLELDQECKQPIHNIV